MSDAEGRRGYTNTIKCTWWSARFTECTDVRVLYSRVGSRMRLRRWNSPTDPRLARVHVNVGQTLTCSNPAASDRKSRNEYACANALGAHVHVRRVRADANAWDSDARVSPGMRLSWVDYEWLARAAGACGALRLLVLLSSPERSCASSCNATPNRLTGPPHLLSNDASEGFLEWFPGVCDMLP